MYLKCNLFYTFFIKSIVMLYIMITFVEIKTNTMKKLLLAIITLGYTSHEEISNYLFGGKSCMPNELKGLL